MRLNPIQRESALDLDEAHPDPADFALDLDEAQLDPPELALDPVEPQPDPKATPWTGMSRRRSASNRRDCEPIEVGYLAREPSGANQRDVS